MDRRDANLKMLSEAEETQKKTREAVERIKQNLATTEEVGSATLEQLRSQGMQMDEISGELNNLDSKLDHTKRLQGKFDVWAGNWGGGKKHQATKEAEDYIAINKDNKLMSATDVYEQQKYDRLTMKWKPHNFVLYANPSLETSVAFDPEYAAVTKGSPWVIDYTLSSIDALGWTYGSDFKTLDANGSGAPKALWNSYVRRRKWRHESKNTETAAVVKEVQQRNQERLNARTGSPVKRGSFSGAPVALQDTGYTSSVVTARAGKTSQKLDDESQAGLDRIQQNDADIDEGLAAISGSLDTIFAMSSAMKEEVTTAPHSFSLLAACAHSGVLVYRHWHRIANWISFKIKWGLLRRRLSMSTRARSTCCVRAFTLHKSPKTTRKSQVSLLVECDLF